MPLLPNCEDCDCVKLLSHSPFKVVETFCATTPSPRLKVKTSVVYPIQNCVCPHPFQMG